MSLPAVWRHVPGFYRDCPWCGGRGCLQCDAEADKAYKRQFPDGPKPILTIPHDGTDEGMTTAVHTALRTLGLLRAATI